MAFSTTTAHCRQASSSAFCTSFEADWFFPAYKALKERLGERAEQLLPKSFFSKNKRKRNRSKEEEEAEAAKDEDNEEDENRDDEEAAEDDDVASSSLPSMMESEFSSELEKELRAFVSFVHCFVAR